MLLQKFRKICCEGWLKTYLKDPILKNLDTPYKIIFAMYNFVVVRCIFKFLCILHHSLQICLVKALSAKATIWTSFSKYEKNTVLYDYIMCS